MSPWPLKNGAAALRPLSSCSQGVSAGAYGKWGAGTAERYKETLWYSALSTRPYRRMIVEYKAPEMKSPKRFSTRLPATTWCWKWIIWLSARLQHYCCRIDYSTTAILFCRIYPVSKLIGGATNPPCLSHLIASYTMRDMRAMMFALSSSVSPGPWRRRQCSISGRREG